MHANQAVERRTVELVEDPSDAVGRGQKVRERRVRLGMSGRELATVAGIDRGRLAKIEKGDPSVRDTTVGPVLAALDRLEHEMSMDLPEGASLVGDPEHGLVMFEVEDTAGANVRRVVVRGPVQDMDELREQVSKLLADFRQSQKSEDG